MENKVSIIKPMKIHAYLEEVLGSPIKVRLLRFLFKFPQRGFGIRELARFLEVNHRPIAEAVQCLRDNNLVNLRVAGRSKLVYLNSESFLSQRFKPIFTEEMDSPNFLVQFIRRSLPLRKIELCALFGSVAQGTENPSSDIDMLIITSRKKEIMPAVDALREKVLHFFGNPLSPLIVTRAYFEAINPPLKESIIKNHLLIYGKW